jgi:hypothetical protein
MGFNAMRCTWWRTRGPLRDRIEIVAGRTEDSLAALEASLGAAAERFRKVVSTSVPPDSDVLVASGGDDSLVDLEQRRGWHFPLPGSSVDSADEAIAALDELRAAGADYLVVPLELPCGLPAVERFLELARERFRVIGRDRSCVAYLLTEPDRGPFRPRA